MTVVVKPFPGPGISPGSQKKMLCPASMLYCCGSGSGSDVVLLLLALLQLLPPELELVVVVVEVPVSCDRCVRVCVLVGEIMTLCVCVCV